MQLMFEEVEKIKKQPCIDKYQKQKWRNKLQKYCDNQSQEVGSTTGYCVCGYMNYCDCCRGSGETNACVKAICEYASKNHKKLDYNDYDFDKLLEELECKQ